MATRFKVLKLYGWWYALCGQCSGVDRAHSQPAAMLLLEQHARECHAGG